MNSESTRVDTQLSAAYYLFLLKETSDPLGPLMTFLGGDFDRLGGDDGATLNLDSSNLGHFYLGGKKRPDHLDVHVSRLDNILMIRLLRFSPVDIDQGPAADLDFLTGCEKSLVEADSSILGTAVAIVDDDPDAAATLKEAIGGRPRHLTANKAGRIIHHFFSRSLRQHYLIERSAATSLHDLVALELPLLSWSLQKIDRETNFFADRLHAILAEKKEIDTELSSIFHQKGGKPLEPETTQHLEEQISRLSSMYSVLATNLHLMAEAAATLDKDLAALEKLAVGFDGGSDESFPQFHLKTFGERLDDFERHKVGLRQSLENTKAAIDIAQTQAELIRGSRNLVWQEQTRKLLDQNVTLQEERVSLQIAAEVIELVVIFYYTLKSWETVAVAGTVESLAPVIKFGVVAAFSISVVSLAHYVGNSLHKKRWQFRAISLSALVVLASFAAMAILPGMLGTAH